MYFNIFVAVLNAVCNFFEILQNKEEDEVKKGQS